MSRDKGCRDIPEGSEGAGLFVSWLYRLLLSEKWHRNVLMHNMMHNMMHNIMYNIIQNMMYNMMHNMMQGVVVECGLYGVVWGLKT